MKLRGPLRHGLGLTCRHPVCQPRAHQNQAGRADSGRQPKAMLRLSPLQECRRLSAGQRGACLHRPHRTTLLAPAPDAHSDDHAMLRAPSARGSQGSAGASPHRFSGSALHPAPSVSASMPAASSTIGVACFFWPVVDVRSHRARARAGNADPAAQNYRPAAAVADRGACE